VRRELLGERSKAVLTSARAKAYKGPPLRNRQLCWAHLCRAFQAMVDRGGPAGEVGRLLLLQAAVVCGWWHWGREGHWQRSTFQRRLPW
jgi:transposase